MKFLNWGKMKTAALNVFRRRPAADTGVNDINRREVSDGNANNSKSVSFTLPDRIHIKPRRIWERKRSAKWQLPTNTKVGTFVIFPFGTKRRTERSGTVVAIRGHRAKIRMICKAGRRIAYRKISAPPAP